MDFNWCTSESNKKVVTIASGSITLNSSASKHFENVAYVLLGVNQKGQLGIKPVTKEEAANNYYPKEQLHHISVGKSYMRISNKVFLQELDRSFNLDLETRGTVKLPAYFDVVHQILLVDLN